MVSNYRFTPEALAEFDNAIAWYEAQYMGIGKRFSERVHRLIKTICSMPDAFPSLNQNLRKAQVESYPYSLIYTVAGEEVIIYAVFHEKQPPEQWQNRTMH